MRILVEALGISKFGGGRTATLNLFEALLILAPDDNFIFLLESFEPSLDNRNARQIIISPRNRIVARLWLQANLPRLAKQERVDLVHFAKNLAVFGIQAKTIVTLYDLTLLQFSDGFPKIDLLYWKFLQPIMLRRIDKIHAISQNTANDLRDLYHLSDEQIEVIYTPYHPSFRPLASDEVERIRDYYGLRGQIIMHIGSFGPKKNLETLIKAFAKITNIFSGKLVLVGGSYRPGYDIPLKALVDQLGLTEKILFTGIVPQQDLPGLINAATVMVYPSLHEGLGMVAIEAMACGTPLIVSAGGALQETVGNSGLIVQDPCNIDELASAIQRICCDQILRETLRHRGLVRSKAFTPHFAANRFLSLYHEVVDLS